MVPSSKTTARAVSLALLVHAAACRPTTNLDVTPPSGALFAAVIEVDADGRMLAGSPLQRWEDTEPLFVLAGADDARVVAFNSAEIEALGPNALGGPVIVAEGCLGRLPAPVWYARWASDAVTPLDVADAPALAVAALSTVCPGGGEAAIAVDLLCAADRCEPDTVWTESCAFDADLSACDIGRLRGTVAPDGSVCVDFAAAGPQCSGEPPGPYAVASAACGVCDLDVHISRSSPPPFDLQRVTLRDGVEQYVDRYAGGQSAVLLARALRRGWAHDFVVLDDRIVATVIAGDEGNPGCAVWQSEPMYFAFVDPVTMTRTGTASAPVCLQRLQPDPIAGGFIGTHTIGDEWFVTRFDRDGRTLVSTSLDTDLGSAARTNAITELVVLEDIGRVVVVAALGPDAASGRLRINVFDLQTLAFLGRSDEGGIDEATSASVIAPSTVVAIVEDIQQLFYFDVVQLKLTKRVSVPAPISVTDQPFDLWRDPMTGLDLLGAKGTSDMYIYANEGPPIQRSVFDSDAAAMRLHPWPGPSRRLLVAGTFEGRHVASVTFFDVDAQRFVPGSWPVGGGVINRVRPDSAGRLWALLPYVPELIRLDPIP